MADPALPADPGGPWRIVPRGGHTAFKKVRVRDDRCIEEIVGYLRNHDYVVLLGPPYHDKTWLLDDVAGVLQQSNFSHPIYLDLWRARSDDEDTFFTSIAHLVSTSGDLVKCAPDSRVVNGRAFQMYLEACLQATGRHLTLLVDHLQALPHDLVHGLLLALRSLYTERDLMGSVQLGVVVTGGMNLADYSSGPTSPFNIAKAVMVSAPTRAQSKALALTTLAHHGRTASEGALNDILHWAGGDPHLIPLLCNWCVEAVKGYLRPLVTRSVVQRAAERLWLADEAQAPIRETIRLVEEDPDTLLDLLDILDRGWLPRAQSRQPITRTGVTRLQLCGATILEEGSYRVKNQAYRQALGLHFQPAQVGRVLRMTGRWREAIAYLAPRLSTAVADPIRSDLLEAIIQSVYAANDLAAAFEALVQGLQLGFGLAGVHVYQADPVRNELRLVYPSLATEDVPEVIGLDDTGCVEARTYHYRDYALRRSADDVLLVAPLVPEERPIGVVMVKGYAEEAGQGGLPPELPHLLRFLRQAAGAIENVILRSTYNEIGQAVLDADEYRPSLDRVLAAVAKALGCDFAALYLLDDDRAWLEMVAGVGRSWSAAWQAMARFEASGEHPAAKALRDSTINTVYQAHQAEDNRIVARFGLHDYVRAFVPLGAAGSRLGVLEIGYLRQVKPLLGEQDLRNLAVFGNQVAIAVYNMQLLRRTDQALARRVEEMDRLREIGMLVGSTLDIDSVLGRVTQSVQMLFNALAATIWEYQPDRRQLVVLQTTFDELAYRSRVLDLSGITGQSILARRPVQLTDLASLSDETLKQRAGILGINSMMAAPLLSRGQVLGAINVYLSSPHRFTRDEEELLATFAAQAAIAIDNARQYRKLEQDTFDLAQALLHRLGSAGDLPYQLRRANQIAGAGGDISDTLAHIEQRIRALMELQQSLSGVMELAEITRQPLDLRVAVREAVADVAASTQIEPLLNLPDSAVWVDGDHSFLRDAFHSVIENAVEAVSSDGQVRVRLAQPVGQLAEVEVIDTGPGITEDVRGRIFELGFSTRATAERNRGRGLYTARAILHRHEGTIRLTDTGAHGSTFVITLPTGEGIS